jgi:hypothetical protein
MVERRDFPEVATSGAVEVNDEKAATTDANSMLLAGAGIGVIGVVGAVLGSAVCPVCVVAAPTLLGVGAYRRWRASRPKRR